VCLGQSDQAFQRSDSGLVFSFQSPQVLIVIHEIKLSILRELGTKPGLDVLNVLPKLVSVSEALYKRELFLRGLLIELAQDEFATFSVATL